MLRYLMAAIAATTFLMAACGGDDAKPAATKAAGSGTPAATATLSSGLEQPTVEDKVLPTPTAASDTAIALVVANGKQTYNPTVADYRALATASVNAAGQDYSGVTIATLAAKVSAPATATVTIQGIRADGKRTSLLRYALADIGTNTVLMIDASGHIALASSGFDKELWLSNIASVAFQ